MNPAFIWINTVCVYKVSHVCIHLHAHAYIYPYDNMCMHGYIHTYISIHTIYMVHLAVILIWRFSDFGFNRQI